MMCLIDAGETTGQIEDMLRRAADMQDEHIRDRLDQAVKVLEPAIIAVLGFVVGFILVAAFLPIYAVVSHL